MNWDPSSALRMRIRAWTALFQEIGLIFWNTSWSKAGMNGGRYTPGAANIYLGPEERNYIRILSDFSSHLDPGVKIAPASVRGGTVRAYALQSSRLSAGYLHHYGDHTAPATGVEIKLPLPQGRPLAAQWIDPATGKVLKRASLQSVDETLRAPPFSVDITLLVYSPV